MVRAASRWRARRIRCRRGATGSWSRWMPRRSGSDLHFYDSDLDVGGGVAVGHEFLGTIVETGPDVSRFGVGDRAPWTTLRRRTRPSPPEAPTASEYG